MSRQVLMSGRKNLLSGTYYTGPVHGHRSDFDATETNVGQIVTSDGVLSGLRVKIDTAPGASESWAFTLYLNGSPTAMTATIGTGATEAMDTANSVVVAPGDRLTVEVVQTGSPATAIEWGWSINFDGTTSAESLLVGHNTTGPLSTFTVYTTFMGSGLPTSSAASTEGLVAAPGTIKNLYVELSTAPGAGTSRTFTLYKNGSSTSLTCTISDTATTGNDVSNTVTVAAGDRINLQCTRSGAVAGTNLFFGTTFLSDTAGESLLVLGTEDSPNSGFVEYGGLTGGYSNVGYFSNTENQLTVIGQDCVLTDLYVRVAQAPGSGKSWTFTLRQNGSDTGLSVVIADTATTGSDTASPITISDGDILSMGITPSGTPADTLQTAYGMVCLVSQGVVKDVIGVGVVPFPR